MELLRGLDRRWRSFRHAGAAQEAFIAQQPHQQQQRHPLPSAADLVDAALAANTSASTSPRGQDLLIHPAGPQDPQDLQEDFTFDQHSSRSSSRTVSPTNSNRPAGRSAYITAIAGYDSCCDSAGSSDISRITPLRIQGFDEIEVIDWQQKPPVSKSRFTGTKEQAPGEAPPATGPVGRRSLAARYAAAAAAAAVAAAAAAVAAASAAAHGTRHQLLAARDRVSVLIRKASQGHLPTAVGPPAGQAPGTTTAGPQKGWRQRLQAKWQKHPALALACIGLLLALVAVILGVSIGVSARAKGRMPWWSSGKAGGPAELLMPTGDPQLDSLLQLKAAVDTNGLLTEWTAEGGKNGGYCGWDYVFCDDAGKAVQAINLTTSTFQFVLQGALPSAEALSGLSSLKSLDIREHHISGPLPEDWDQLPLQVVRLDQNMLEGELPDAWFADGPLSQGLQVLTLNDNALTGSLPDTQGTLKKLEQLDLSYNRFSGSLPSSWSSMASLQQLWLDSNKLSGPLPSSWGALTALQKLVLSENGLLGALPPSWSDMRALQELWLEYNNLSGQLPEAYSSLSSLATLVLNNNSLSLTIPKAWSQLKALKAIYMYNNGDLSGCVPASWKAQFAPDFDADSYLLEGTGLSGFCATS